MGGWLNEKKPPTPKEQQKSMYETEEMMYNIAIKSPINHNDP